MLNIRSLEAATVIRSGFSWGLIFARVWLYPYAMDLTLEQVYYTCVEVAEATLGL